ncbi:hypothetical protein U3516DRAFT_759888 [Neocallimastix sp. 'constans']
MSHDKISKNKNLSIRESRKTDMVHYLNYAFKQGNKNIVKKRTPLFDVCPCLNENDIILKYLNDSNKLPLFDKCNNENKNIVKYLIDLSLGNKKEDRYEIGIISSKEVKYHYLVHADKVDKTPLPYAYEYGNKIMIEIFN